MWTKNILKAFDPATKVRVYIGGQPIADIQTVRDFLENGLMTYNTTKTGSLAIENGTIIISC